MVSGVVIDESGVLDCLRLPEIPLPSFTLVFPNEEEDVLDDLLDLVDESNLFLLVALLLVLPFMVDGDGVFTILDDKTLELGRDELLAGDGDFIDAVVICLFCVDLILLFLPFTDLRWGDDENVGDFDFVLEDCEEVDGVAFDFEFDDDDMQ